MPVRIGIAGKHPGYGDFIGHGLDPEVTASLTKWIDKTLSTLRESLGEDTWPTFWDNAQGVRFWVGRAVLGRTVAGLFLPSRDKVGRRYPLIFAADGAAIPSPLIDPDQSIYEQMSAHVAAMVPGSGAGALIDGFAPVLPEETPEDLAQGPIIWAHHPEGDLDALMRSAAPVDAERALTARSYWWAPATPGRAAAWLGQPGLPGPEALGWVLGGVPAEGAGNEGTGE